MRTLASQLVRKGENKVFREREKQRQCESLFLTDLDKCCDAKRNRPCMRYDLRLVWPVPVPSRLVQESQSCDLTDTKDHTTR